MTRRRRKYGDSAGGREKARERGEGGVSSNLYRGERVRPGLRCLGLGPRDSSSLEILIRYSF